MSVNVEQLPGPGPLQIGMLLYPGLTLLDLIGPQTALGIHGQTHLISKSLEPIPSDSGIAIVPTATYDKCPRELDVLFVPGGMGTANVMEDVDTLCFLEAHASTARFVTSVCSGSLILAAAGLLQGYRATTHWSSLDVLAALGVEVDPRRVVVDRNRITGGGVTAGIDFGLTLVAQLCGEKAARLTQLTMEYDPSPPFDAGSPEAAGPGITALARSFIEPVHSRTLRIARTWRDRRESAPVNRTS